MTDTRFRQAFLLVLVAAISIAFVAMIRTFLLTILLSAIFTGLSYPMYQWLLRRFRGRSSLAAIATLVVLLTMVVGPLLAVLGAGANEALRVTETIRPRLERLVDQPGEFNRRLRLLPGYRFIEPYRTQIFTKAGELLGSASAFTFAALSATTKATAVFIFHFVILLYTMFFFLTDGPRLLNSLLSHLPLPDADKERMLDRFVSVTRATVKGTLFIGAAQGLLGGLAFRAAGIDGAIFWGTVMTVLSIIPGVGGALIWLPAAIILMTTGEVWRGIALAAFCGLVIGSVDESAPAAPGRPRHANARAADLLFHAGRALDVRRDGIHRGTHPGGAVRDGVGNVCRDAPQRARRANSGNDRRRSRLTFTGRRYEAERPGLGLSRAGLIAVRIRRLENGRSDTSRWRAEVRGRCLVAEVRRELDLRLYRRSVRRSGQRSRLGFEPSPNRPARRKLRCPDSPARRLLRPSTLFNGVQRRRQIFEELGRTRQWL